MRNLRRTLGGIVAAVLTLTFVAAGVAQTSKWVATGVTGRLIYVPDAEGRRPCHGASTRYAVDPQFRDLVLFHEYFHGDDGRGLGANHQTGWTALAANLMEKVAWARAAARVR